MAMLSALDWAVIAMYFLGVFTVAFTSISGQGTATSEKYFLAGRNAAWWVIGASLFASNIGSEHLIGLAGAGASTGLAVAHFEILASLILLLLGWVFVPIYLGSGVFTMPEFLERRYSPAARWYLAVVSVIAYVLTKISVTIYAGGVVFESLFGVDFWTGAVVVVVATGFYTVFGGLRAVLYTDMVQAWVLIAGAAVVTIVGLREAGGFTVAREVVGNHFFEMWKPMQHPEFPWTGIVLGAPILGVWYWCTDQFIVQRVLSAANVEHARRGAIFAGFLKLLPLFIFVLPGIAALALARQGKLALSSSDQALPALIGALLPAGLRGLVCAGLLAALMSSLSSVFNSCSTLVTWDIYKKLHPQASERQLVWVGQLVTAGLVLVGILWIPFMQGISGQLYTYLQSVQAYISPPIASVFLLGIFFRRFTAQGALAALGCGFVLGSLRLILELNRAALPQGFFYRLATLNFLHFAALLFAISSAILVLVSLFTPAPPIDRISPGRGSMELAPATHEPTTVVTRTGSFWASLVLIAAVLVLWWVFR
jgi:SSS family solute:Na+ symporter